MFGCISRRLTRAHVVPCQAEMPSYCVKALENTQSILCGLFLSASIFSSGRITASTALDFRGIFVLLDLQGCRPPRTKGKKHRKDWLSDVCALVNRRFQMMKRPADRSDNTVLSGGLVISCKTEAVDPPSTVDCSRACGGRLLPLGVPVFYRGNGALSRDRKPVSAEKFGFGGVVGDK